MKLLDLNIFDNEIKKLVLSHLLRIRKMFDNMWQIIKGSDVKNRSKINEIFQES